MSRYLRSVVLLTPLVAFALGAQAARGGFGPAQGSSSGGGSVTWPLTVPSGLGAVTQIVGPADQALSLASPPSSGANAKNVAISGGNATGGSNLVGGLVQIAPGFGTGGGNEYIEFDIPTPQATATSAQGSQYSVFLQNGQSSLAGSSVLQFNSGIGPAFLGTCSGPFRIFDVEPNYHINGTGTYEILFMNPNEQALGSGTNYLIRCQTHVGSGGTDKFTVTNGGDVLSAGVLQLGASDNVLSRQAAGVTGLSNSTNPCALRLFNTTDSTTSPTNAEWLETAWSGNVCTIQTTKSGTGTNRELVLKSANGLIGIEGATSSFPGFSRSGTVLQCVLADASLFADFKCQNLQLNNVISTVKGASTAGYGVPAIYAAGRATAQTAAKASLATFTPSSDGSFEIVGNVLITTLGSGNFTMTVTYTDESNSARTTTLPFCATSGTIGTACAAAAPFQGVPIHIRAKAATAITLQTTGTFTSCTYNCEAFIKQES